MNHILFTKSGYNSVMPRPRIPDLKPYDKQRYSELKEALASIVAPKGLYNVEQFAEDYGFARNPLRAAIDTSSDMDPNRNRALTNGMYEKLKQHIIKHVIKKPVIDENKEPLLVRFNEIFAEMRHITGYEPHAHRSERTTRISR